MSHLSIHRLVSIVNAINVWMLCMMREMMVFSVQLILLSWFCGVANSEMGLFCFNLECDGDGCLFPAITSAGDSATTCSLPLGGVCYVEYKGTDKLQMVAGCKQSCDFSTVTTTTEKSKSTADSIIPRRKRSTHYENTCCSEQYCNHGSPCGSLTCAAERPLVTIVLLFVPLFLH